MSREILLVEPNYKNKYPPMGLMKISTYYKELGDHVTFFKGDLRDLVLRDTFEMLKAQLYNNDETVFWEVYQPQICEYLKKGSESFLEDVPHYDDNPVIKDLFKYYRKFFYNKDYFKPEFRKYDRVGITTLFTFYWDITIETINFAKKLCKDEKNGVMIGGVMASILPDEIERETGIRPHVGTLHTKGELDKGNKLVIDSLPLDYSILEEIDYQYPANNAYFAYMTRGCVNKCPFCAVPKLEPNYIEYLPVSKQVKIAEGKYGAKRDLLLLDNNVLASCQFDKIIDDIKKAGFAKGATYIEPNLYEIAIANLRSGCNDRGYIRACVKQLKRLLEEQEGENAQKIYELMKDNFLLEFHTAKKEALIDTYEEFSPFFEELYSKNPRKRYVDFNQGIDSRLVNDRNMKKLAEIPIRPVRIAFDHWSLRETYKNAVKSAVRNGHKSLSNYILYNFEDEPIELYKRLRLNVELSEELDASIYSFPMKYHPIDDPEYFMNRDYIGVHWNRKFIRAIQAVLNSTKGKIGRGKEFFEQAFGVDEDEFMDILWMPETFIIYRRKYDKDLQDKLALRYTDVSDDFCDLANEWRKKFHALSKAKREKAEKIIALNKFKDEDIKTTDKQVLDVLKYYQISRSDAEVQNFEEDKNAI